MWRRAEEQLGEQRSILGRHKTVGAIAIARRCVVLVMRPTFHMDSSLTNIDVQFHMDIEKSLTNICKSLESQFVFGTNNGGKYGLGHCGAWADGRRWSDH